jgi:hypothetical protein
MIHTQCHTANEKMSITFDAEPWFRETDAESISMSLSTGGPAPGLLMVFSTAPVTSTSAN